MAMGTEERIGPPILDGPLISTYYPQGAHFDYYSHPATALVPDGFPMPELPCAPPHSQPFVNLAHQLPDSLPPQMQQHQVAMSPSVSSRGETPSALGSPWSVPECEDMEGYSYQGSPLGAVPYKQGSPVAWSSPAQNASPSPWSSPAQGPNSPSPWSSPAQVFRQVDEGFQQQNFQQNVCSPVSGPVQMQNGMYAQTSHPFTQDAGPTSPGIPISAPTSNPATSAPAQAPVKLEDNSSASEAVDRDDGDIRHQPYSKQLVQALLSHPRRAMTVQQIYKWFEENTDRHESSGWQNSIRHNLSLNKVRTPIPTARSYTRYKIWRRLTFVHTGFHNAAPPLLRRRLPKVPKQGRQARQRVGPRALRRKGRPQHRKVPPKGLPLARRRPPPQVLHRGPRPAVFGPPRRLRHEPHEAAP